MSKPLIDSGHLPRLQVKKIGGLGNEKMGKGKII